MDRIRSFLAVDFGAFYKEELKSILSGLQGTPLCVKWIDPEQVHLTLHFFGSIDQKAIGSVIKNLEEVLAGQNPIEVYLKGLGAFPNPSHARVIWAGIDGNVGELEELKERVDQSLEKIGITSEKRFFKPHLTLGRLRQPDKNLPAILEPFSGFICPRNFHIDRLVLFRSDLEPRGPRYSPMHYFMFRKADVQ